MTTTASLMETIEKLGETIAGNGSEADEAIVGRSEAGQAPRGFLERSRIRAFGYAHGQRDAGPRPHVLAVAAAVALLEVQRLGDSQLEPGPLGDAGPQVVCVPRRYPFAVGRTLSQSVSGARAEGKPSRRRAKSLRDRRVRR